MCRSESRHAHGVTRHALFAAWQAPSTGGCPSHATDGEPPHTPFSVLHFPVCQFQRNQSVHKQNQKWYLSQNKWYFSHFAKTQKEIHTLSPEPDGAHPRGPGVHERAHAQGQMRLSQGAIDRKAHSMHFTLTVGLWYV